MNWQCGSQNYVRSPWVNQMLVNLDISKLSYTCISIHTSSLDDSSLSLGGISLGGALSAAPSSSDSSLSLAIPFCFWNLAMRVVLYKCTSVEMEYGTQLKMAIREIIIFWGYTGYNLTDVLNLRPLVSGSHSPKEQMMQLPVHLKLKSVSCANNPF